MTAMFCVVMIPIVWVMLALGFGYLEGRQKRRLVAASLNIYCRPGWVDEVEAWLRHQH